MSWILYAVGLYLAASYGLLIYMLGKLLLGRSMRILVGPQSLQVTEPATEDAADEVSAPQRDLPRRMAA